MDLNPPKKINTSENKINGDRKKESNQSTGKALGGGVEAFSGENLVTIKDLKESSHASHLLPNLLLQILILHHPSRHFLNKEKSLQFFVLFSFSWKIQCPPLPLTNLSETQTSIFFTPLSLSAIQCGVDTYTHSCSLYLHLPLFWLFKRVGKDLWKGGGRLRCRGQAKGHNLPLPFKKMTISLGPMRKWQLGP